MAIHSINDFKHLTGQTAKGRRRSPFSTLSYNADQPLHDEQRRNPEKPYHKKHPKHDNTKVVLTEIYSSDSNCRFADISIPSVLRREQMWNELVRLNKKISNRIMATSEIALPNCFDPYMIFEFSKRFCESLSEHFKRPVDWSVHDKTKAGQRNLHAHIAIPERELNGTKWNQLSTSFYVDMDGNTIYDKIYKDEKGNDIRKPKIREDAPRGHEYDIEIDAKTGERTYKYQKKDSSNRKKWCMKNSDWLNPTELQWIHNEYDRICNQILKEHGINDTVKRYSKEAKSEAQKAGLKIIHSNIKDAKANTLLHQENEQNNKLARQFMDNHENIIKTQKQIESVDSNLSLLSAKIDTAESQKQILEENQEIANSQFDAAKTVLEKSQRDLFKKQILSSFQTVLDLRNHCLAKTEDILNYGINVINEDIQKLTKQKYLLPSQKAKLKLLEGNKKQLMTVLSGVQQDQRNSYHIDVNEAVLQRWRTLDRESKAGMVYAVMGDDFLSQYKSFYNMDSNRNIDKFIPGENIVGQSIKSAIEDCEAPSIVTNFNISIAAQENILMMFERHLEVWRQDLESEYHTPPRNTDILLVVSTIPDKFIQYIEDERKMDYITTAVPSEYDPLLPYRSYINSWSEDELRKHTNTERKVLEELRQACIITKSEKQFNDENDIYIDYEHDKKAADTAFRYYSTVKEEEEETEAKKRSTFLFEGTVNERRIERYKRDYEQELDNLNNLYPDGVPQEPDFDLIKQEVSQEMRDKTPKQLLILAKEIKVPPRFIGNYNIAKAVRNDYESLKEVVSNPLYGVSPVAIRWEDKEHHKLNEMEKAERNLYRGWHPK